MVEHGNDENAVELLSQENYCSSPGCGKLAHMACPTCVKLGVPHSRFCNQECFKENWNVHKVLHNQIKKARSTIPNEFTGYRFTGKLRPCQKTAQNTVPEHIARPDYADHPTGFPMSEQEEKQNLTIKVYNDEEVAGIREACRIGREVLDIAGRAVRVGVTCDEIDKIVHEATIERNAYPSTLNYYQFPKSLCTSVNEVICHGIPDQRALKEGDIVNLDISVYKDGFHADLNETFFVGPVDQQSYDLVKCAHDALAAAIATVRPGMLYRDVGEAVSNVVEKAKFSICTTYGGHGIGRLFHTTPNIPHYAKNKAKGTMLPGHIFTIEPMINIGTHKDVLWPDNWAAVTADGSRSAQFEHTMLVTETGVELLTARIGEPRDRIIWSKEKFQR